MTIWTEWAHPCEVTLHVTVSEQAGTRTTAPLTTHSPTVTIGNHHYALLQLGGLQASTWYVYSIASRAGEAEETSSPTVSALKQCFRTLDPPESGNALRLAYGSGFRGIFRSQKRAALYQLVASPFVNRLDKRDTRLILTQAHLKRAFYGGLHTRLCRLSPANAQARITRDILMQNTVALVTFEPVASGYNRRGYSIKQTYLGVIDGKLAALAHQHF